MGVTVNGFNVGTDVSITMSSNFGDFFTSDDLGYLMEFDAESEDVTVKIVPCTNGGKPVIQTLWSGMRGHFMLTRFNGAFQNMVMSLQNKYYAAGIIPQFQLMMNVRNRDSSIDEVIFTGMQFERPRFGNFRSTKEVDMRSGFRAAEMVPSGSLAQFLSGVAAAA